jgi:hypothetical protein
MKPRSCALLIAFALLAFFAPTASADRDKAAIDEYAESLPAAEQDVHPALSGSEHSKKKSQQQAPAQTAPQQQAPAQQEAPAQQQAPAQSSSSGSSKSDKADKKKSDKKKKSEKKESDKDAAPAAAAPAEPRDPDSQLLDRISSDPALGAPPATDVKPARSTSNSDDEGLLAAVFDPSGALLWLLLGMIAVLVIGAMRLGGRRSFEQGSGSAA